MIDRKLDLIEIFQSVPENIPLLAFQAAIGFIEIEFVDRIVGT